jgi:hypothetical protein
LIYANNSDSNCDPNRKSAQENRFCKKPPEGRSFGFNPASNESKNCDSDSCQPDALCGVDRDDFFAPAILKMGENLLATSRFESGRGFLFFCFRKRASRYFFKRPRQARLKD